uniref:Thioredoxin domain-containing protein n=1 Tax=Gossypium raimondii TaxID=29730 RepID=A0A0D2S292_GOSRA|nr:hypothetical protein B456_012G129200 [Gossypium raimondii]
MASVTESIAALSFPTTSRFRTSLSRPAMMISQPAVSLYSHRGLPEFKGLKVQSYSLFSFASTNSRYPRVSKHSGRIVCEAQETAIDNGPVLVEFWAPWCGPCRMIDPVIGELAQQYAGKLKCFKLNTDDSPSIASQYGIRSIPTLMIFLNGEKKDAVIGAVPKSTLSASIERFL